MSILVRRHFLLGPIMLFGMLNVQVEASKGTLAILSELKALKDGSVALCEGIADGLEREGHKDESKTAKDWCNDWLSVLGVNKGLTGLAKDFVLNYLGRSAYHDKNGPLIGAIKKASAAYPQTGELELKHAAAVREALAEICSKGTELFQKGGAVHDMLHSLKVSLDTKKFAAQFDKSLIQNPDVKKAFAFLSGPLPAEAEDYDPDLEDAEL